MLFQYLPYFDYTQQKADITPITDSPTPKGLYDMKDFNPIIDNASPLSQEDCKSTHCGDSFNWSARTYVPKDKTIKITVKITRYPTHEKAQRDFDNYVLAIKKSRYDKFVTKDGNTVFISSVRKLRWDFPPTPTGAYASRVVFLKNNIMLDVLETSRSKHGEYKNPYIAALGGQLRAVTR
jgi:hypothetical protein